MAKDTRNYVIKVTKDTQGYHTALYEDGKPKTNDLDFDKNGDGLKKTAHYKLNFTIDDSAITINNDKVMFAPSNAEVLAVHTDLNVCPPVGNHMADTLWVDKNVNGRLRLINMDLKDQKLRFKINLVKVSDQSARPFIELDPIIKNGNQGSAEPLYSLRIAPIVAGAIAGIGAAIIANNGLMPTNTILFGIGGAIVGLIVGFLLDRS